MSDKLKELREQHDKLCADARAVLESSDFNEEKEREARFDKIMADADAIAQRMEREQKLTDQERRTAAALAAVASEVGKSTAEVEQNAENYRAAFNDYLRHGMEGVGEEYRGLLRSSMQKWDERAQSVTGGSPAGIYGGYTVADEFLRELERAQLAFGDVESLARVLTTATGATITMPFGDDTGNKGAILGENQPITEQDTTFTQDTLSAYKYTSKLIRVPYELFQDSAFDISAYVAEIAGERIGRILNEHFTTGDGSAKPEGVVTGSTAGVTAAGTTGITYNDLVDLEHSVPRAYRTANARFMFNDATLKILRKLKDADGRPIWQPSLQAGVASNINGRAYSINDDMANVGTGAKSVLFGDFRHYIVRKVKSPALVRLNERYAEMLQVGFFVWTRYDAKVKDAGKGPIRHLVHASGSP